ncbi:MAG: DUF2628 domain-containing protein [Rhodococcus sp.]|nr:DUF2628 domain-containing protein [Rhodococcus sp. (in: high G+C Gram-positive bacteria)]
MVHDDVRTTTTAGRTLSDKWQFRFDFFDAYGIPGWMKPTPEYAAAFRALSFRDRMKITTNFCAVFFNVFYLLYLGLWRKAITVFAVGVALGVVSVALNLPGALDMGISVGWWLFVGQRTNIYYYEHVAKGRQTWGL